MSYLIAYILLNIIFITILTLVHDLILYKKNKKDYMFLILLSTPLLFIYQSKNYFYGMFNLILFFIMCPFIITTNIVSIFEGEQNKLSKEYNEYFYFKINLKNKTKKRIAKFLNENKIKYKNIFLNNISSYALKTIHEMIFIYNIERINILKNHKEEFLTSFSEKIELERNISDHLFFLIKEELCSWILENQSLDGIDNMYVYNEEIVVVNKHFNKQPKQYERKTINFKEENINIKNFIGDKENV